MPVTDTELKYDKELRPYPLQMSKMIRDDVCNRYEGKRRSGIASVSVTEVKGDRG